MESLIMTVAVITVSDRASRGEYEDKSGPVIENLILDAYPHAKIFHTIVPDEQESILKNLNKQIQIHIIFPIYHWYLEVF